MQPLRHQVGTAAISHAQLNWRFAIAIVVSSILSKIHVLMTFARLETHLWLSLSKREVSARIGSDHVTFSKVTFVTPNREGVAAGFLPFL